MNNVGVSRLSRIVLALTVLATACAAADQQPFYRRLSLLDTAAWRIGALKACSGASAFVLIAIDGVRSDEVFDGVNPAFAAAHGLRDSEMVGPDQLMPHLHRILRTNGVALGAPGHGPEIRSSGPAWCSLPGYQEIFTGHPVPDCRNNSCPAVARATLADEFAALSCSGPRGVAVISSWETIERAGAANPSAVVMSTGRNHGMTREKLMDDPALRDWLLAGERAKAFPGQDDYRPDRFTAGLGVQYLRAVRPRFLFLGLGDPDEHAHHNDYRAYLQSLRDSDQVIGQVASVLRDMERDGVSTTLVITTDHGRSRNFTGHGAGAPESGRVWLVVAGSRVLRTGRVEARRERYLADIAPTLRAMAGLAPDFTAGAGSVMDELFLAPIDLVARQ
ncbi:MAG: sulfatase-like hydrolase/transferase [Deltaproteobacteria bacterium]|nr:sulfatase-like hydrolase/transferase [Deltaproteobacteria bacterium]